MSVGAEYPQLLQDYTQLLIHAVQERSQSMPIATVCLCFSCTGFELQKHLGLSEMRQGAQGTLQRMAALIF